MRLFRRFRKPAAPPASPPPPPQSILLNEGKICHAERFRFSHCLIWCQQIWNELVFCWVNRRLTSFIACLFLTVTFALEHKTDLFIGNEVPLSLSCADAERDRWMIRMPVPCSSTNGWQRPIRQLTFFETWMRVCVYCGDTNDVDEKKRLNLVCFHR